MKLFRFISGFIYALWYLLLDALPLCIDAGSACIRHKKFSWQFDDMEKFFDAVADEIDHDMEE